MTKKLETYFESHTSSTKETTMETGSPSNEFMNAPDPLANTDTTDNREIDKVESVAPSGSKLESLFSYTEACPDCHKTGIRRGLCRRGGGLVQRLECAIHGDYYYPDLVDFNQERIRQKIDDYLFGGGSQKSRARELGKSRQVIIRRFRTIREYCLDDLGIVSKFKPDWGHDSEKGGIIVLDASRLDGTPYYAYVAFDERTHDAVCYTVGDKENKANWLTLLRRLDGIGHKTILFVSDKGPLGCLRDALARHYPGVPHQLCWGHELEEIDKLMPPPPRDGKAKRRRGVNYQNEAEQHLYALIIELRHAANEEEFERILKEVFQLYQKTTDRGRVVIKLLQDDHQGLKARYAVGVDVATNNTAECGFSRFKHLYLNASKGLHAYSRSQAKKAVNVLWAACRVKPMDDSSDPWKRGKATLELAKANIKRNDIWQFVRLRRLPKV